MDKRAFQYARNKMAEEERKDILWRRFISLADHPVLEKVP